MMFLVTAEVGRAGRWGALAHLKEQGKWREALGLVLEQKDPLVSWLQPTMAVLEFIGGAVRRHGLQDVVSVGCGTGLFEWLLASATGLRVEGVEVDRQWWQSPYSPPTFLPLVFADEDAGIEGALQGRRDAGLLFVYFNDTDAFLKYEAAFEGRLLLVVGPAHAPPVLHPSVEVVTVNAVRDDVRDDVRVRDPCAYCHPNPFSKDIPSHWRLDAACVIAGTGDYVAVYTR